MYHLLSLTCTFIALHRRSVFDSFLGFFKTLFSKTTVAGAQDLYNWMLFFDCLCFITIALGYSSFAVSKGAFARVWVKV